ncbi:MAG: hypothetical protein EOO68_20265 [Moraxellaceae bacterium]|nr:MAG: hypothetical protein EOO68_20265 [Moraxellaceae bacterium]
MFKLGIVIAAAFFLSGCVSGTRTIELATPKYQNDKTAKGQVYIDIIEDKRVFEAKPRSPSTPSATTDLAKVTKEARASLIGRQRNGYGKAMGDVTLPKANNVQKEMRDLLKEGFESRGYTVSDNKNAPIKVQVDINKFWAWFTPGMWAVSFEANLDSDMNIANTDGNKKLNVVGYGINKGQVASDANWMLAYERAFEDFLKNLDKALDDAKL